MNSKICAKFEFGRTWDGEPILWRVLDASDGKLLVISEYIITAKPFDEKSSDYDKSWIKKFLEDYFIHNIFTKDEEKYVEKIFLLSKEEVKKYFKNKEMRKCKGTKAAILDGLDEPLYACWWTRTAEYPYSTFVCREDGSLYWSIDVYKHKIGVRPALWIKL